MFHILVKTCVALLVIQNKNRIPRYMCLTTLAFEEMALHDSEYVVTTIWIVQLNLREMIRVG